MKRILAAALQFWIAAATSASDTECKCVPDDPCWPSAAEWQHLNDTVAGALIRGVPPGSVCYADQPNYNETHCEYVLANWFVSTFHADDPVSVGYPQWADNPCPPIYPNGTSVTGDTKASEKGCSLGGYPVYVLNATRVEDVQTVVKFAKAKRIRLNVKSTGHSFAGRSTGYGSLGVWTHYLQGITYLENFRPESCSANTSHAAFEIAAGARVRDVYEAASDHGMVVVAGSAQDVGIVGWASSGGHGPLSSTYGMGADNILQAKIVTPNGEIVTANECAHPDLYWAIRGGGGGTFGVITKVVMKAFPEPTGESVNYSLQMDSDAPNETAFWEAFAYFVSEFPRLKRGGLSGYHTVFGPPMVPALGFTGGFSLWDQDHGTAEGLMRPVKQRMASWDGINFTMSSPPPASFFKSWNESVAYEPVGAGSAVLGSRLIPAHPLENDSERVGKIFRNLTDAAIGLQIYAVANSVNRDLDVALNPAWREAVVHTITVNSWPDGASEEVVQAGYDKMTDDLALQLKSLAPDSGAYHNEADPHDPNWKYTFFGENYDRLRSVKHQYDPEAVLWCLSCVGSENWEPDEIGRLCRVPWSSAA